MLMKGNQSDITNNLFRNLICLRAAALGERETGTILGGVGGWEGGNSKP